MKLVFRYWKRGNLGQRNLCKKGGRKTKMSLMNASVYCLGSSQVRQRRGSQQAGWSSWAGGQSPGMLRHIDFTGQRTWEKEAAMRKSSRYLQRFSLSLQLNNNSQISQFSGNYQHWRRNHRKGDGPQRTHRSGNSLFLLAGIERLPNIQGTDGDFRSILPQRKGQINPKGCWAPIKQSWRASLENIKLFPSNLIASYWKVQKYLKDYKYIQYPPKIKLAKSDIKNYQTCNEAGI